MVYCYISNTCEAMYLYRNLNRRYNQPFIGSLFVNDHQYIKFCRNIDYYCKQTPIIGEPTIDSLWAKQNSGPWFKNGIKVPYVVMYLDDIEIHWIHENNDKELLEKYHRRLERMNGTTPVFTLSCSEQMNHYDESERLNLIKDFLSLDNSVYLSRTPDDLSQLDNKKVLLCSEWINVSRERDSNMLFPFNSHAIMTSYFIPYILHNHLV